MTKLQAHLSRLREARSLLIANHDGVTNEQAKAAGIDPKLFYALKARNLAYSITNRGAPETWFAKPADPKNGHYVDHKQLVREGFWKEDHS